VAQLYTWALGSLSVASYDSQGYGGGILTSLSTGLKYSILSKKRFFLLIFSFEKHGVSLYFRSCDNLQVILYNLLSVSMSQKAVGTTVSEQLYREAHNEYLFRSSKDGTGFI
jgi:hypothetical protein